MMKFALRKWKLSDAENFFRYCSNPKVAANMRASFPSTPEQAGNAVKDFCSRDETRQLCRAIEINGEAVGCVAVFLEKEGSGGNAVIAYWLGEPFWGHGIMTRAVQELCCLAFERYDIERISAEPLAHNVASQKVLEKAGFYPQDVGKGCGGTDTCAYALTRKEPESTH